MSTLRASSFGGMPERAELRRRPRRREADMRRLSLVSRWKDYIKKELIETCSRPIQASSDVTFGTYNTIGLMFGVFQIKYVLVHTYNATSEEGGNGRDPGPFQGSPCGEGFSSRCSWSEVRGVRD